MNLSYIRASALALFLVAGCEESFIESPLPPLKEVPSDLAEITFSATGQPSYPYAMLELSHPQGFMGFVIVNGEGKPVWFFRTVGGAVSFTRRENGNFVFLDLGRGLVEVTPKGNVVRELAQGPTGGRLIHNDVVATNRNSLLFLADEWRSSRDTLVNGVAIWEWYPEAGSTVKRWSSFDNLTPAFDRGPRYRPDDWLHANSLSIGPRENLLVSSHFLDQVISISADYRSYEWRLGGTRATIPVDDPFSGQHNAQEIQSGRVLMFDNGFERDFERYSRAVEYQINGSQARKVWEWRPQRDNWAKAIGAAWRIPNGNTFVAFGVTKDVPIGSTGPIEVYEVTVAGAVVWHLVIGGKVRSMYRATPLPGL